MAGDFAMLLKAGMSVRQTIFYNLLSSFLSYIIMVAGLLLGQITDFTPWIFSATAGIFLYVALVRDWLFITHMTRDTDF